MVVDDAVAGDDDDVDSLFGGAALEEEVRVSVFSVEEDMPQLGPGLLPSVAVLFYALAAAGAVEDESADGDCAVGDDDAADVSHSD